MLVPLLCHIHLPATGTSRSKSLRALATSWSGETRVCGLAGGPSFAGAYSYLHTELDGPAKN